MIKKDIKKYLKMLGRGVKYLLTNHYKKIQASLIILIICITIYGTIIGPSYNSMSSYYSDDYTSIIEKKTSGGLYNPNTDIITNYEKNGTIRYKIVQLHEECHRQQHYENRSLYNIDKKGAFMSEIECNIEAWKFWRWHTV